LDLWPCTWTHPWCRPTWDRRVRVSSQSSHLPARRISSHEITKVPVSHYLWPRPWPCTHPGCRPTWGPSCASLVAIQPCVWEKKRFAQIFTNGRMRSSFRKVVTLTSEWDSSPNCHVKRLCKMFCLHLLNSSYSDIEYSWQYVKHPLSMMLLPKPVSNYLDKLHHSRSKTIGSHAILRFEATSVVFSYFCCKIWRHILHLSCLVFEIWHWSDRQTTDAVTETEGSHTVSMWT